MGYARELAELATAYNTGNPLTHRNKIINGAMVIDQRNAGASVATSSSTSGYSVDRWAWAVSEYSKMTLQQNAGSVTPPEGFIKYLGVTSSSAYSISAGDYFLTGQAIEGFNIADLGWGTANAKPITISFWVRSSLTGTFGASLLSVANGRSYVATYTISAANTWEYKTITIAGDTTGTWATDNTVGIRLWFGLGVGSTYSKAAGSWGSGTYFSATGATSVVGTNGATFYITGVQLEAGRVATPFEMRSYTLEDILCKRYYERLSCLYLNSAWNSVANIVAYKVQKRASPTLYNTVDGGSGGAFSTFVGSGLQAGTDVLFQTAANSAPSGGSIGISAEL